MRLWTIQDKWAYLRLQDKGVLCGDWRRLDSMGFKPAYKWLCAQMESRGISLKGRSPMWAWTHKPDMRHSMHRYRGKHGVVVLELEVPDHLVLVSNFDAWHDVLNDHFTALTDEEVDRMFDYPRDEVIDSWQRIFDNELCVKHQHHESCQATFPTIEIGYLVKAKEFWPRKNR